MPVKALVRFPITNPPANSYKRKQPVIPADDVEIYRQLTNTTTSLQALTLRSENQSIVEQTPWLRAAFWSKLAELKYVESEAA